MVPSEQTGMMAALEQAGIPVKLIRMNPDKGQKIGPALQALCSKDTELKARTSVHLCYFFAGIATPFDE